PGGDLLGRLAVACVADGPGPAHRLGLGEGPLGRGHRQPAGHQEVPGITVGHVEDVALVPDLRDIGPQDDLHSAPVSASTGSSAGSISSSASSAAPPTSAVSTLSTTSSSSVMTSSRGGRDSPSPPSRPPRRPPPRSAT